MHTHGLYSLAALAFTGAALPIVALAQAYPTKAIRLIVPFPPGGSGDVLARLVLAPQELPVGVLTSVLGGGYLLFLMSRQRGDGMR